MFYSTNIKLCLDNTGTAVIANINTEYELNATCQADMIHIFKRQFPLVLVTSDQQFKPTTDWLNIVWNSSTTQKVSTDLQNFEDNLHNALRAAQWDLSSNLNITNIIESTKNDRSMRFSGDLHEWTVVYRNPAQISQIYRELINDPLRIATVIKLQDIYYNYVRIYFTNSDIMSLFEKAYKENNIHHFIEAYTRFGSFSAALNYHLSGNILYYFEQTLHDTLDYQLVKCLVDVVALFIYRQELCQYLFTGRVFRGVVMSEEDLFKYVVGSRVMNTTFLSASKVRHVAEMFCGQQGFSVLCTIVIHNKNNRRTALDIECKSWFPHEQEVLILPFSAFIVQSVKRSADKSGPIEMVLVEDDPDTMGNTDDFLIMED